MKDRKGKRYFLDDPRNVTRLFWGFAAACLGLMFADLFYEKEALFPWEGWFGFEAFYGFLGVTFIVFAAIGLRKIVMRPEDYYERMRDDR